MRIAANMLKGIGCLLLAAGCHAARVSDAVDVEAQVERYAPRALHEDYDDGRWATFDAVTFRILSPPAWKGTPLTVYSTPGNATSPFQRTGSLWSFTIRREDFAGPTVEPKTGKMTTHNLFDGALENLKELK
jgi:hypothetical protein